jgi:CRISPR-associated exonuclease Cas4
VNAKGGIKVRKTASLREDGSVEVSYAGYVSEPSEWWLKADATERLSNREEVEKEATSVPALKALLSEKGKITKKRIEEFQMAFIEEHRTELTFSEALESSPFLGTKNVGGGVLPDFYLVPAIRDLSDETKVKSTTMFGRLLQRAVQEMASRDPQFIELRDQLQALINRLNPAEDGGTGRPAQLAAIEAALVDELKPWGVKVVIEVVPPDLEKLFELGTELHLDDGIKTLAERKGHGLQRAVLFALLRAWAKALRATPTEGEVLAPRKTSESLVFAVEEPELFLHPHAQRRLASAIRDIAGTPEHQVFVCTHSTHFIDLDHYKSIAIIFRETVEQGTTVRQCVGDLFAGEGEKERKDRFHMAAWVNPDRGEIFFAKKVVLVEGETEAAVLPYLAEKMACLDSDVSVVDCGSKYNIPLYVTLLKAFHIPYMVVHDEDPLPDPMPAEWDSEKRDGRQRLFKMNEQISRITEAPLGHVEMFRPDFETVAGVSKTQGEKKGKALAALEHFEALDNEKIPQRVVEVVHVAYGGGPK